MWLVTTLEQAAPQVLWEMMYRRIQKFERSGSTRKSVSRIFRDDLLTAKVKQILYEKGG